MEFKPITDPSRLLRGDLMLVPSESGSAHPKLHVSLGTLKKHGLSIGFTGRSDNNQDMITRTLVNSASYARTFWVGDVREKYYYNDRERKYRNLVGNVGSRETVIDKYKTVCLYELPTPSVPIGERDLLCRNWCRYHKVSVAKALRGFVRKSDVTAEYSGTFERSPDMRMKQVFESMFSNPDQLCCRDYERFLPTESLRDYGHGEEDGEIEAIDTITDKFLRSTCFEPGYSEKADSITMVPKFAIKYAKLGAEFLRPSEDFEESVSRYVAAELMRKFASRQLDVMVAVSRFLKGLREDVTTVKSRARRGAATAKRLALNKKETSRVFGRLTK